MIIGKINFPVYPVIILVSIVIGMIYIYLGLKKEKCSDKNIMLYFILYICFSIAFGKLFTLIINPQDNNLLTIGLSSYGGLVGVIVSAVIFEKILPLKGKLIKYSIISLPLVYSISKIACFLAGCCYGIPYNHFFSVTYTDGLNIPLFPVQLVETITFFIIFLLCNNKKNNKNIILYTIILSATTKFLLDFLRYDHVVKTITVNQIFSILLVVVSIVVFLFKKNNKKVTIKK